MTFQIFEIRVHQRFPAAELKHNGTGGRVEFRHPGCKDFSIPRIWLEAADEQKRWDELVKLLQVKIGVEPQPWPP